MKISVRFESFVDIHDVKRIVNYSEQGWKLGKLDEDLSDMVMVFKTEEIDTGNYSPMMYAKAISKMSNGYFYVADFYYKDSKGKYHYFKRNENEEFEEEK